jgi:hypothetical protein
MTTLNSYFGCLLIAAVISAGSALAQDVATPGACTALTCPASSNCDQQFGSPTENGENADLGYEVNPGTGNLFLRHVDIDMVPALGPNLRFERYYNNQAFGKDLGLGAGWSHTFSWSFNSSSKKLFTADGRVLYWTGPDSHGNYTPQAGEFGTLVHQTSGSYLVHEQVWHRLCF